jgi:hypothetical protein
VKLEISYTSKDGNKWGTYSAIVKQTGTVTTKLKSGDDAPLTSVNQYSVEELRN